MKQKDWAIKIESLEMRQKKNYWRTQRRLRRILKKTLKSSNFSESSEFSKFPQKNIEEFNLLRMLDSQKKKKKNIEKLFSVVLKIRACARERPLTEVDGS